MLKKRTTKLKGFTFVELMVATVISFIVILGVGIILFNSQRGWNTMYRRIHSGIITDGHVARRTFDTVIRKAGKNNILLGEAGSWLKVSYYQDSNSLSLDRYSRFYQSGDELKVEYGDLSTGEELSTQTICSNVSSCIFKATGSAAQMILRLDDGSNTVTIMSSAIANN